MSNTMTAKVARKVIRGEMLRVEAQLKVDLLAASRIDRATGGDSAKAIETAASRVQDALEYAEAALACYSHKGKSALKDAEREGLSGLAFQARRTASQAELPLTGEQYED